ncbi:organic cation transporter protein-like [Acanthaster planci]|uniref:Organic cation transporter protein-like n=1 Tax=Acanthaster planci TaxID=133434 RepID=A0A8B7ZKG0_ACAPL|nr:organic cation transporter protein-like [Acanthaster planci]
MHFDRILVHVGAFGKFQKVICVLLSLVAIPCAWHSIAQVFLAAETDHLCAVPADQSLNCTGLDLETAVECLNQQKELTIPFTVDKEGQVVYSKCERYVEAWDGELEGNGTNGTLQRDEASNETIPCDRGWEYDRSQYHSTIIQDFDLVCSRKDLPGLSQSVFFAGLLTGSFIWGAVADWCGRKLTIFISLSLASVICTANSFVPTFAAYTALRFFIAGLNFGVYLISFVLVSEIVGPTYRSMVGTLIAVFFSIGYALLAVIAYQLRQWRQLHLAISLPWFLFFLILLVIPESPRWLVTKKKYKEAEKIIKRVAHFNGKSVPENLFDDGEEETLQVKTVLPRQATQIDLFRTPNMRRKTLNIFFNWFVNSLVYYGLSLSTSGLGVDDYVAAFVSGAVEMPGYLSSWLAIQKLGRRLSLFLYLCVGGLACLTTIFIAPGVARATVAMIGKFAISGSFNIIYIYSAELYPTPVRSMGVGMSSMSARLSGVIAPVILILGNYWEPIPLIVFGGCSLLAGALALLLPETLNHALPETIQEGEEFGKGQGFGLRTLFKTQHGRPADGENAPGDPYKRIPTDKTETPCETSPM